MGIRDKMNENTGLTTALAAGIILVAIGFIVWNLFGFGSGPKVGKAWFTIDDGKTWFADDADRIPPFDHDGQPAVGVVVFTYEGAPEPFAGYLVRYTPEARAQLEAYSDAIDQGKQPPAMDLGKINTVGKQYKAPGAPAKTWVSQSSNYSLVGKLQSPLCPDGKQRPLQEVRP